MTRKTLKPLLKSGGVWLALFITVVLAVTVTLLRPKPHHQFITLPNGDVYEYAGVTYGTNLVPPSILCRIARHLPAGLTGIAQGVLGNRISWTQSPPQKEPVLSVWFRQVKTNNAPSALVTVPYICLADSNDFPVYDATGTLRGPWVMRQSGWFSQAFSTIPRRSAVLRLLIDAGSNGTQQVTFRNPLYGTYPQWQPRDTLPATNDQNDLRVSLNVLTVYNLPTNGNLQNSNLSLHDRAVNVSAYFRIFSRPESKTQWDVRSIELGDATGNSLSRTLDRFNFVYPRNDLDQGYSLIAAQGIYFPSLWPGENAWRFRFEFKQAEPLPAENFLAFTNVPIPKVGSNHFDPVTKNLNGTRIRFARFIHQSNAPSIIIFDLPDHPADMMVDMTEWNTPAGKPVNSDYSSERGTGFQAQWSFIPTNATTMDITVAVRKLCTVDFYIKPPY